MATTYTVKKGDTLWSISTKYASTIAGSTTSAKVKTLVKLNDITDPYYIVVGQVLKLDGAATTPPVTKTSRATIKAFGLQSNTDRTIYATWAWTKTNTESYRVIWYYATGDGVWFVGEDSSTNFKQSLYRAPSNATRVKFKVKPISKKHKVNKQDVSYWTASWSTEKIYDFDNNTPLTPPVPTVKIDKYTLTAELTNLDVNATSIQFQVVKNDITTFKTGTATIKTASASFSCAVTAGGEYKVRCRSYRDKKYSDWSDYSSNVSTIPSTPVGFTNCEATSETSVYLEWKKVATAKTYEIEYATKKRYFDESDATTKISNIEFTRYEITGLESGQEYFFRVRSVNDEGNSTWSDVTSIIIGKKPAAPTTWSSTTTVIVGEILNLYWVHNAEDGSSQTFAELELIIDGVTDTKTIKNSTNEETKDKTSVYTIDTSDYIEGTTIQWRVRTAGITQTYGDWSVQRTVDVYAPPTLELSITNKDGEDLETIESFPFYVSALAGPNTQLPIGYHLVVTSNEVYETIDNIGNRKIVNSGETIYSHYFDISEALMVELSAGNINLDNNISYTVTCTASMNSGLTAEASSIVTVSWTDMEYEPNAEIGIDEETYTASIRPYCENEYGVTIQGVLLSVYRREFDGKFTELATGLENVKNTTITDPHPSLDYARYRIVATVKATGAVSYCDIPGYPVGCTSVIIQWDEDWTSFNTMNEDEMEEHPWAGSMLVLPYNIDVSEKQKPDVALVEYIGREHPVSYYGTQLGQTATWNMSVPKEDKETLYALRRLSIWMGDVYVREPSGSGYWAHIKVSFSQKHCNLVIPVSIDITRVSGGI